MLMNRIGKLLFTLALLCAATAYSGQFADITAGNGVKQPPAPSMGYAKGSEPQQPKPAEIKPVKWVYVRGGDFEMSPVSDSAFADSKPVRKIKIADFEMSQTLVTVEQYKKCVDDGGCTEPETKDTRCNWDKPGRERHPVNCVEWNQAALFAEYLAKQPDFTGARLPSESEWEYAARHGGKKQKYPWGDQDATCKQAVMFDINIGKSGCGGETTMPVCSKPDGNVVFGKDYLCDMAGNVFQWVQDKYQKSYEKIPEDGTAFMESSDSAVKRVVRGGAFHMQKAQFLRADMRGSHDPAKRDYFVGFRLARAR